MENITEVLTDSKLDELLSKHNFENICKTKINNVQSKSTTYLPTPRAFEVKAFLTEGYMPSISLLCQQQRLEFIKIPRKYSDEPTHLSDDMSVCLKKEMTLESDYRMIEMNDMLENLDNEILIQFRKMSEFSKQICSLPVPSKAALMKTNKSKTLALDLDETLIHSINGNDLFFTSSPQANVVKRVKINKCNISFVVRPFLQQFLNDLSTYYNIVV
jgi:NLI interacting factor-like phosphatase